MALIVNINGAGIFTTDTGTWATTAERRKAVLDVCSHAQAQYGGSGGHGYAGTSCTIGRFFLPDLCLKDNVGGSLSFYLNGALDSTLHWDLVSLGDMSLWMLTVV